MENKITRANDLSYPVRKMDTINYTGLTKREYFASMAMQGFITKYGVDCQEQHIKQAVFMAEFLIEELNKTR